VAFFHSDNGQTSRSLYGNHLALIESSVREDDDASSLMIGDDDEPIIIGDNDEHIITESSCPGVDEDLEECEGLHARHDVERDEDIVVDDAMGPISVSDAETTVNSRSSKSRRTTDTDMAWSGRDRQLTRVEIANLRFRHYYGGEEIEDPRVLSAIAIPSVTETFHLPRNDGDDDGEGAEVGGVTGRRKRKRGTRADVQPRVHSLPAVRPMRSVMQL